MMGWILAAYMAAQSPRMQWQVPVLQGLDAQQWRGKQPDYIAPVLPGMTDDTAVLALLPGTGQVLYSQHADRPQYIASITKLLTVLTVLEAHSADEIVTIPPAVERLSIGTLGLQPGQTFPLSTLLEAALIPSANDAAVALALYHSPTLEDFAGAMEQTARTLGIADAVMVNPTGLDEPLLPPETPPPGYDPDADTSWTGNRMSARSVALLAQAVLADERLRAIVRQVSFRGESLQGTPYSKWGTNQLLGGENSWLGVAGVKTGYTLLAGECVVTLGTAPDGTEVLTVVLGSADRFTDTQSLLSWLYDAYSLED